MRLLLTIGAIVVATPIVAWMAGAIYYDVCGAGRYARRAALAWSILWLLALAIWHPVWKPLVLLLGLVAAFLAWWLRLRPSQSRAWDPHFAQTARIAMQGDVLTIENVRNSEYHGIREGTAHYETRSYRLSELRGLDALILTWGSSWMSHPMFIFDFGAGGRVCFSIEVRYREGQRFSVLRSLYRQQELMYVVSDERDAILRRVKYLANHTLYLYRMNVDDLTLRQFFFEYATSVNSLAARPRWYHGVTRNCTTALYAQARGRIEWNWRLVFNGDLDRTLYNAGFFDQALPFARLKDLSRVNEVASAAPEQGFGDYLRANLPGYTQTAAAGPAVQRPPAPPVDS
jgi:hypothetical protein